ncbi:MAG: DUF4154 domain-containing protein [Candidatus Kapabacteria bacterium]|nr:DUF4154 domain-containing protein [Candidatus Kapabacteria bacterium]
MVFTCFAQTIEPNLAAVLVLKVAAMEKKLGEANNGITIYVVDAPEIARELRKVSGSTVGKTRLESVTEGPGLPAVKPDVLFVGSTENASKFIRYARQNHILTISTYQDSFDAGTSIYLGKDESTGKSYIALNITASKEEALEWNPALLKIARSTR